MALENFCLYSDFPPETVYLYVVGLVLTELIHRLVVALYLERKEMNTSHQLNQNQVWLFPETLTCTLDSWLVT